VSAVGGAISVRRDRTTLVTAETVPPVGAEAAVEASTPPPPEPGAPWPPGGGDRQEVD
jgi:hypothetical protein